MPTRDEMFCVGYFASDPWFGGGFEDFLSWLAAEQRRCQPKGIAPQSMWYTTGAAGLNAKYPTFMDAYEAWKKEAEKYGNESKQDGT